MSEKIIEEQSSQEPINPPSQSFDERLNSSSDEDFEAAIQELMSGNTRVVSSSTGEIETVDSSGSVIDTVDDEKDEPVSDSVKDSNDSIELDGTDTEDTNEGEVEHSSEVNDENEEEVVIEEITENSETDSFHDEDIGDEIDYKEFYNKVTSGFKVNGLDVQSLSDPDLILELQKRNLSKNESSNKLNDVMPILDSLREAGLTEDREKFGMLMEILDGNPDAIKKLLKEKNIDPYELDMDEINEDSIDANKYIVSNEALNFKAFVGEASSMGVRNEVADQIIEKWDDESLLALVNDEEGRGRIVEHVKTGMYSKVQARILGLKNQDPSFSQKTNIDQYVIASNQLADEIAEREERTRAKQNATKAPKKVEKKSTQEPVKKVEPQKKVVQEANKVEEEERIKKAEVASKASVSPSSTATESKTINLSDIEDDEEFIAAINKIYDL